MKMFSENSQAVLKFLQSHDGQYTANDIAEALGIRPQSVNGVVTSLQRKHLAERLTVEGFEKKVIALTTAGATVDPDMEKVEGAE